MYLPQFQTGTGALTAPVLNQLMDAARISQHQNWSRFTQNDLWHGPHVMKVLDSELMTGETTRWGYSLAEVFLDENGDPEHVDGMSTTEGKDGSLFNAFNAAEFCNTATHVQGFPLADLPGTFELKPIADDTLVLAWFCGGNSKLDTGIVAIFSMQNVIAGDCE